MVKHFFVLPENRHLPSGGNWYNSFLIQALKKIGVPLSSGSLTQGLQAVKKDVRMLFWVDSLCLTQLPILMESMTLKQRVFMIIHHLPSFEPDLSQAEFKNKIAQEKKILSEISGFLVTSPYVKNLLMERSFKHNIFVVVPPALCLEPREKKERPKGFRGLMVANLIHQKGVLEFLKYLEKEIKPGDDFILNIAGRDDIETDYANNCTEYISGSPSLKKSVRFFGPLSLEKIGALYASSSVFISSSKMETYGMAVKEALAFGLPVLAYNGGYVRSHIRPGVNGYVCSTFSDLAQLCSRFIRNPKQLKSLRERTEKLSTGKNHTWDKAAEMFLEQTSNLMRE